MERHFQGKRRPVFYRVPGGGVEVSPEGDEVRQAPRAIDNRPYGTGGNDRLSGCFSFCRGDYQSTAEYRAGTRHGVAVSDAPCGRRFLMFMTLAQCAPLQLPWEGTGPRGANGRASRTRLRGVGTKKSPPAGLAALRGAKRICFGIGLTCTARPAWSCGCSGPRRTSGSPRTGPWRAPGRRGSGGCNGSRRPGRPGTDPSCLPWRSG